MRDYTKFYIDGEWVSPLQPRTLDVINPATEAAAGVISKSGNTWSDPSPTSGVATFYRLVNAADDNSASTTYPRIQGTVGTAGADLNLSSTTITGGVAFTINYYTQALVPS